MGEVEKDITDLKHVVLGCLIDVHKHLGPGFLENIYHRAAELAFNAAGIPFRSEHEVDVLFLGTKVGTHRLDFLIDDILIVEFKTVESLIPVHFAQVRSYLRATRLQHGLLINFNEPTLGIRKIDAGSPQ